MVKVKNETLKPMTERIKETGVDMAELRQRRQAAREAAETKDDADAKE